MCQSAYLDDEKDVNFTGVQMNAETKVCGVPPMGKVICVEEPTKSCIDLCVRGAGGSNSSVELYLRNVLTENNMFFIGLKVSERRTYVFRENVKELRARVNLFNSRPLDYRIMEDMIRYRYDILDKEDVYKAVKDLAGNDITNIL